LGCRASLKLGHLFDRKWVSNHKPPPRISKIKATSGYSVINHKSGLSRKQHANSTNSDYRFPAGRGHRGTATFAFTFAHDESYTDFYTYSDSEPFA
jgi:hypothetical protein